MHILSVFVSYFLLYVAAKPVHFKQNGLDCHGIICPTETISCIKNTETSDDQQTLITTVKCKDLQGNILNSATDTSENPYRDIEESNSFLDNHYRYKSSTAR